MAVVFFSLLFLICKVQSQLYGPGSFCPGPCSIDPGPRPNFEIREPYGVIPSVLPNVPVCQSIGPAACFNQPLNLPTQPCIQNQIPPYPNIVSQIPNIVNNPGCSISPLFPNLIPQVTPSVITNPVLQPATTPVATTIVDNTLANSLANAIQLLIVSNLIENTLGSSSGCGNSLAQSLGFLDAPCINNYDVVTPDYYPNLAAVTCEYPGIDYNPCICEVPCYQEPVVYQPLCVETPPCASNFGNGYGSPFSVCESPNSFNCGPNPGFGIDTCSNLFGSIPVRPSFGCVEPALATVAPMAVEVPFPASIPAQLVCNFGYMPTNTPCVSVNVEPLPFDSCNNFFGNFATGF